MDSEGQKLGNTQCFVPQCRGYLSEKSSKALGQGTGRINHLEASDVTYLTLESSYELKP